MTKLLSKTLSPLFAFVLLLCDVSRTEAAVIVSIPTVNVSVGGTGTIEVFVAPSGASESLSFASIGIKLNPIGGATSGLRFVDPPTLTVESAPNYLFGGNSANTTFNLDGRTVSTTDLGNDTFAFNDATASFNDFELSSALLLLRAQVESFVPIGEDSNDYVGEQFEIEIVSVAFNNMSLNPIPIVGTGGVLQLTAIPEPSTILTVILSFTFFGFRCRSSTKSAEPC
jgi:hypothetical protein